MRAIAATTFLVTLVSGLVMHLVDRGEFPTLGRGLWWAAETVTTVGYGDVVPAATSGRIVAVVVMLNGIGFLSVATGAITAALLESRARRHAPVADGPSLEELYARLEALLREQRPR